jgi:flagellar P-ring protein precursor FlgI
VKTHFHLFALLAILYSCSVQASTRIKDVTSLQNVRDNQVLGYGLVVGLSGTGDSLRSSPFTEQAMQSMLDRLGINTRGTQLRAKNVAAVLVTADMPAFTAPGSRIDVAVSSLGDATSLMGGTLVLTPLVGADGATYAVAQGQVSVTGFSAQGRSEIVTQGVPTSARIVNGAIVERRLNFKLNSLRQLHLQLHNPDFNTSANIASAINSYSQSRFKQSIASQIDHKSVRIIAPNGVSTARLMSDIGILTIQPDSPARVIIDPRSGTVVISRDVKLSPTAITHGSLTIRVTETPQVSQPNPLAGGNTVVTNNTTISNEESGGQFMVLEGPSLRSLVRGLNQTGVKPNGVIAILQALKASGALQAELIVQQ